MPRRVEVIQEGTRKISETKSDWGEGGARRGVLFIGRGYLKSKHATEAEEQRSDLL